MSHWCWCWRWRRSRNICHSRLYVIFEGGDVAFFFHDDAERRSEGNVPSSFWHHDFGQVSLLLHLKTYTHMGECDKLIPLPCRGHQALKNSQEIIQICKQSIATAQGDDGVRLYRWSPCRSRSQPAGLLHPASLPPSSPSAALFPWSWWETGQGG